MGYTASDLLGVGIGFAVFALFAFAPGYTFAWLTNVFDFRRRRLITRLTASIPISIGLTPVTAYLLWLGSLSLVWTIFGASGAICIALLIRDARSLKVHLSRSGWLVLAIAAAWLLVGALSLVDLQFGNRLYMPFSSHDLSTHVAFAAAIARDGIPPHNPFFFAGRPAPLKYHYFWYIPCALVDLLGGSLLGARLSVIAGVLWAGLGLCAIVALYLRLFQDNGGKRIEKRVLIAVCLIGVSGLDLIPILIIDFFGNLMIPTLVWWNDQLPSWLTTMIWSPHDLASLVAGLTGFLLTWHSARQHQARRTIPGMAAAGLAFASAVGSSIYIGGTLAAGCGLWLAICLAKKWWRQALLLGGAGLIGAALIVPFYLQLTHGGGGPNSSTPASFPFSIGVRPFPVLDPTAAKTGSIKMQALFVILMPLNFFLEFGFFFLVGCLVMTRTSREGLRSQSSWAAAALSIASLLICTFVRSTAIANNDLGLTSALVVLFILLLCAAEFWNEGALGFGPAPASQSPSQRRVAPRLVTFTLLIGAVGSCYGLFMQRAFPMISQFRRVQSYKWIPSYHNLGRRTFELRRAYSELDRTFSSNEVIQADPNLDAGDVPAEMYSGRQMVADVGNCGTTFGGSEKFCNQVILPRLKPLFEDGDPVTLSEAQQTCREFSISALLFKDTDPVWKDKSSWIWKSPALISNDFVRVVPCGKR